jgi:photosystem II stability/assembly factor-like uncharacterized protein
MQKTNNRKYISGQTLKGTLIFSAFVFFVLLGCREKLLPELLPISEPTDERIEAVHFVNETTGFIAGGKRFESSRIFRTDDLGQTWQEKEANIEYERIIFDLYFKDDSNGFAVGLGGKVLRTNDQGLTWKLRQTRPWSPLHGVSMAGDSTVVVVGGNGYNYGIIHRSTDLGITWTMIDTFDFELRDVVFTDEKTGFAAGYGVMLKTEDGGLTWDYTSAQKEFFSALSFPSPQVGYAVGRTGTIVKTTDGGDTWKRIRNGNTPSPIRHAYSKVFFLNEEVGYIVGDRGLILKTTDGGKKWAKFDKETKAHLYDIFMFEEGHGVIVGDEGTVIRFEE